MAKGFYFVTPFPLINAVINTQQKGDIFPIDAIGKSYFIIHKSGFSYCFIFDENETTEDFDKYILKGENIPQYFHVYSPPQPLIDICSVRNKFINTRLRSRIQLQYLSTSFLNTVSLPDGFYVKKIDESSMDLLEVFNLSIGSKFWSSMADFLENGFGFCVYSSNGEPASVCYSACVSNGVAEIDVATLPQFQNKGLAKIAVTEFVRHCLKHNIIANWDCFKENIASLNTAESIGFKQIREYPFLSIFKK